MQSQLSSQFPVKVGMMRIYHSSMSSGKCFLGSHQNVCHSVVCRKHSYTAAVLLFPVMFSRSLSNMILRALSISQNWPTRSAGSQTECTNLQIL